MERLSDLAIEILNELHTERLAYNSEYLPLIEAAHKLAEYEATGFEPEKVQEIRNEFLYASAFGISMTRERFDAICSAERDGRLVALPCKIGDVLDLRKRADIEADFGKVYHFDFWRNGTIDVWIEIDSETVYHVESGDIGKTVFFAREDAEKAPKAKPEADT